MASTHSASQEIARERDLSADFLLQRAAVAFNVRSIASMDAEALLRLQVMLGYGVEYGLWVVPSAWLPPSVAASSDGYVVDIKRLMAASGVPSRHLDCATLVAMRYAAVLAMAPVGAGKKLGRHLKPSTIRQILKYRVPYIVSTSLRRWDANDPNDLMCLARSDDIAQVKSVHMRRFHQDEIERVNRLHHLGLWPKCPVWHPSKASRVDSVSAKGPRAYSETPARVAVHQPLPDSFVSEVGWRVLWFVKNLGPSIIELATRFTEVAAAVPISPSDKYGGGKTQRRQERYVQEINRFGWADASGRKIEALPFELRYGRGLKTATEWHPKQPSCVTDLMALLQAAHMWIALFSMGARVSELLSLETGCVKALDASSARGRTYKLESYVEGVVREWPLPQAAVNALQQQERLARVARELGVLYASGSARTRGQAGASIWCRLASGNAVEGGVNWMLCKLVTAFGFSTMPGGSRLTSHRFRKTLARLGTLAMSGAPKVLMDLFGHKDVEMTLAYMLSDPDIRAEIRSGVEKAAVLLAADALAEPSVFGGRAAPKLCTAVNTERARLGRDLGADDIRSLAEVLTLNGQAWELVRPGVICTKLPGSVGPCSRAVGHPQPARCSARCEHRLEQAYLHEDVEGAVEQAVMSFESEEAAGNEIMMEYWGGQIVANVRRFDDIFSRWKEHPTVQRFVSEEEV